MSDIIFLSDRTSEVFPDQWYSLARDDHFWMQWRLKAFLHQIQDLGFDVQTVAKGMEIGCGDGVLRRQLQGRTGWIIDGADINAQALGNNVADRGATYFYDIFDRRPQFREAYDFIILFDVLEHITDEKSFLEAVKFHLKKGGRLFINVPALNDFHSDYDKAVGHIRRYDVKMMSDVLRSCDFQISDLRYWGFSMLPLLWLRKTFPGRKNKSREEIIRQGFKPPHPAFNAAMKVALRMETTLLKRPFLGTSLLAAAIKT